MDIYKIQADGSEELLASGLTRTEVEDLREWFCSTKPLGPGIQVVAKQSSGDFLHVRSAGNVGEPLEPEARPSRAAYDLDSLPTERVSGVKRTPSIVCTEWNLRFRCTLEETFGCQLPEPSRCLHR